MQIDESLGMRSIERHEHECMRSTALAIKDEYDEAPVSPTEVLEASVASIRVDLNELKTDFRAAVARIDSEIKNAVTKLEAEIRAMASKAEKDLQRFADRFETQISELRTEFRGDIAELRADNKHFASYVETQFAELRADSKHFAGYVETQFAELRADNKSLREKVDKNFQTLYTKIETEIKETNKALSDLSKMVLRIDSRLSAMTWVGGGLVALITLAITAGKAFKWF